METAATIHLTYYEAVLVDWIDQALATGRINRDSPTFTGRGMAVAIEGLPDVMSRPNEREIGVLLDRMGVFPVRQVFPPQDKRPVGGLARLE